VAEISRISVVLYDSHQFIDGKLQLTDYYFWKYHCFYTVAVWHFLVNENVHP